MILPSLRYDALVVEQKVFQDVTEHKREQANSRVSRVFIGFKVSIPIIYGEVTRNNRFVLLEQASILLAAANAILYFVR